MQPLSRADKPSGAEEAVAQRLVLHTGAGHVHKRIKASQVR